MHPRVFIRIVPQGCNDLGIVDSLSSFKDRLSKLAIVAYNI
tara:strand:+ start:280 stop:402 length:123 start_codon:yes stop_codon:yes gene_type:complete